MFGWVSSAWTWLRRPKNRMSDEDGKHDLLGPDTAHDLEQLEVFLAEHGDAVAEVLRGPESHGPDSGPAQRDLPILQPPLEATSLIESGAMGEVYDAFDREMRRHVAVKVARTAVRADEARVYDRLLSHESRCLAPLRHRHIVFVYGRGQLADGRPYYVMERVYGWPLSKYVRSQRLDRQQTVELIEVVARAVGSLHERGIVHCDLKPANILIESDGQPKVIDFGMARIVASLEIPTPATVDRWIGGGTPGYRAPELPRLGPVDVRADVYSLGAILRELITGLAPNEVDDSNAIDSKPLRPDVERSPSGKLPRELAAIIEKCTAEKPVSRYDSAEQLANDLTRWLTRFPVQALAATLPAYRRTGYVTTKFLSRWRWQVAAVSLVACLGIVGVGARSVFEQQRSRVEQLTNAESTGRLRAQEQRLLAESRRERAESQQHRAAIVAAKELFDTRRIDDAKRALVQVPSSRWGLECDVLAREVAAMPRSQTMVGAHDWGVVAVLADREHVISAGHDGRLLAWSVSTGACRTLRDGRWSSDERRYEHALEKPSDQGASPDAVVSLAWMHPGKSCATASLAGLGLVWDVDNNRSREVVRHDRPLLVVGSKPSEDGLLFGDDRGTVLHWREGGGEARRTALDGGAITAVAAAPGSAWWVGQVSGVVRLLDGTTWRELLRTTVDGPVWQFAQAPNGGQIAIACQRPAVAIYDYDEHAELLREKRVEPLPTADRMAPRAAHAIGYSPSGDRLIVGDDLGRLIGFDAHDLSVEFIRDDQGVSPLRVADMERWPWPFRRRCAGIVFSDEGRNLVTAGHDTLIKTWRIEHSTWTREIHVGPEPLIAFDPLENGLLWIGTGDGRLALVDAQTGCECDRIDTGSAIAALSVSLNTSIVATAAGRSVQLWRASNGRVGTVFGPISCAADVLAIALDPDGRRVAAYLENGSLQMFDIRSNGLLATSHLQEAVEKVAQARIAFNNAGDRLAVVGPLRSVRVLDAHDLHTLSQPNMVAGQGGTSLAWHPQDPTMFFVGDAVGRVTSRPEMDTAGTPEEWTEHAPIVALAMPFDGSRLLAATPSGRVVVIDPKWLGPCFSFDIPNVKPSSPVTGVALNGTARILAASRRDGSICLLPLADANYPIGEVAPVSESVCFQAGRGGTLRLRPSCVALDQGGNAHAVYLAAEKTATASVMRCNLVLGSETKVGWRELVLHDFGRLLPRAVDAIDRSLSLAIEADRWYATAKLHVTMDREAAGGLQLVTGSIREGRVIVESREAITDHPQQGFDPVLVKQPGGRPHVLHFSHAGHYLMLTRWAGDNWATTSVGRQGDGYRMHATSGPDGLLHVLFRPTRFNGDRSLPVCVSWSSADALSDDSSIERSQWTNSLDAVPLGITVSPRGKPVILYSAFSDDGQRKLIIARREEVGWSHQVVIERLPRQFDVSNLVNDPDGRLFFAITGENSQEVSLVTVSDEQAKIIAIRRGANVRLEDTPVQLLSAVQLNSAGEPTVLVAHKWPAPAWIRVFRCKAAGSRR